MATSNTPKKENRPGHWRKGERVPGQEICNRARRLGLLGITNDQLCLQLRITNRTFNRWMRDFPTFASAVMQGKIEADSYIAESLYNQGMGAKVNKTKVFYDPEAGVIEHKYEEEQPPVPSSTIFWLKNRHPKLWRDVSHKNHNIDGPIRLDSPEIIDITDYSEEERAELDRLIEGDGGDDVS
jgi:hypothetical protein